jgi:hypothetical protein
VYRPLTLVAAVDFSTDKASRHFDIISVNRGDMNITKYCAVDVNKTSQSRICILVLLHGDLMHVHCKVYTYCTGGYSDYDFGGSRVYIVGVKNNSKDFRKTVISKY